MGIRAKEERSGHERLVTQVKKIRKKSCFSLMIYNIYESLAKDREDTSYNHDWNKALEYGLK